MKYAREPYTFTVKRWWIFSIFIDACWREGRCVRKLGREREREGERECDKVINGRSQEHATFTHRIHLKNVCVLRHLASFQGFFAAVPCFFQIQRLSSPLRNAANLPSRSSRFLYKSKAKRYIYV